MNETKLITPLKPPNGLYVPIFDYFKHKSKSRLSAKPPVTLTKIYLGKQSDATKYSFRLYDETDLKLKTKIIERTRDDDYDTDDDILDAGKYRTECDLYEMFNSVFISKVSMSSFVRNLHKPRTRAKNLK